MVFIFVIIAGYFPAVLFRMGDDGVGLGCEGQEGVAVELRDP